MIEIVKAPPYATIQDLGFPRGRAWGLPPGGAMDQGALAGVNGWVRNPPGTAAIEWALGPLVIRCERETELSVASVAELLIGTERCHERGLLLAPAGIPITLVPQAHTRFGYLAVRGGIAVRVVLGSRSTYLPGGFGGFHGRRLQRGDRLRIGNVPALDRVPDQARATEGMVDARPGDESEGLLVRAIRGPQWDRFDAEMQERFFGLSQPAPFRFGARFTVDRASDRMGYRLSGPAVLPLEQSTLPSEPACPGAVQIPDNGQPIVLMPDGPTVGGYPKLAVVVRRDLGRLAQCQPGRGVRFVEVSLQQARAG